MTDASQQGRIITFYSYKGGTGRSMVLANIAWILASNGHRVLTVDWDLEAPGLHRYFHPFLLDRELTATEGVIDFVTRFSIKAMTPAGEHQEEEWYHPFADLSRYAVSLNWGLFPSGATLDFVPAGKQGSAYASRVNSFDWQGFYERLGGGALLEETKRKLRADYDYVLIDSRTGVSDTSGICTVDMPDLLVVCFTLNVQSIEGAAAVANSVTQLRTGADALVILPVPMRTDPFEKDRLERARDYAYGRFNPFLPHIRGEDRQRYWGDVEVMYQPFYAYEEVLAVFGDRPGQTNSVLGAVERIVGYITNGEIRQAIPPPDIERDRILEQYGGRFLSRQLPVVAKGGTGGSFVFISYTLSDGAGLAADLADALESGSPPVAVWLDKRDVEPGQSWDAQIVDAIRSCDTVLAVVTLDSVRETSPTRREWERAVLYRKPFIPLLVHRDAELPLSLADRQSIDFTGLFEPAIEILRERLAWLASPEGKVETIKTRLADARRELQRVDSDAERAQLSQEIQELQEQILRLQPSGLQAPGEESGSSEQSTLIGFRITVESEQEIRVQRSDGAVLREKLALDPVDRTTMGVFQTLLLEGKLTKESEIAAFGSLLYRTLFPQRIGDWFEQTMASLLPEQTLRVELSFDDEASDLAALPWEYAYVLNRPGRRGFFLAERSQLVLLRRISLERQPPKSVVTLPLRIEVAIVGSMDQRYRYLREMLVLESNDRVEVRFLENPTIYRLLDELDRYAPHILHIVSSFRYYSRGETAIALAREDDTTEWLSEQRFSDLLTSGSTPRIVILNIVGEGASGAYSGFSKLAGSLIRAGIDAVVTIESLAAEQAAAVFVRTFYQELLSGRPIDIAVQRGRIRLFIAQQGGSVFALPTLYVRGSETVQLFQPATDLPSRIRP